MPGGELFDHILAHRYLKEEPASKLFAQLISGVHYLHSKNIVHRDLKLENLLLDKGRNVIITDFGFANTFETPQDDLMSTSCGSPCYAAPELVITDGTYVGTAVDIWSCGVILYAMLSGYLPFDDDPANPDGDNINLLYKYILNTTLQFPSHISDSARDLLLRMLVPEPTERANLREIMAHPWLAAHSALFTRSVQDLETISNNDHREKRVQARREMQDRLRQAKEREAAEQSGVVRERTRPAVRPGTTGGETSRPWVRPSSEMSSTLTMPEVHLPEGLAPPPHSRLASSAPDERSPALDVIDPFAAGPDRNSWIATTTDRDSDFFLEGEARGEPRSRVESAASASTRENVPHKAETSTQGSSRQKKQRHTIQVEYDQPGSDATPSRSSSSRSRTTSVLSTTSPKIVSNPTLSPPVMSPVHGEIAIILAPPPNPSVVPLPSSPAAPQDFVEDEDVKMASPPLPSVGEFPSSPSATPESIPIALPTPAPSKIITSPSTPPNQPASLPEVHNQTPKASARQASPPDTPRASRASTEPALVVAEAAPPPPPLKEPSVTSSSATEMGALPAIGSSAPLKQSSSGRSRMSIDRFGLGNFLGGRSSTNIVGMEAGAGVGSKGVSGLPEVSKEEKKASSSGKKDRRKTFSMMSDGFSRSISLAQREDQNAPTDSSFSFPLASRAGPPRSRRSPTRPSRRAGSPLTRPQRRSRPRIRSSRLESSRPLPPPSRRSTPSSDPPTSTLVPRREASPPSARRRRRDRRRRSWTGSERRVSRRATSPTIERSRQGRRTRSLASTTRE